MENNLWWTERRIPNKRLFRRGVAQPGSALAWGASGRWFKSSRPDQFSFLAEKEKSQLSVFSSPLN
jgi:hypothetical protein